MDYSEADYAWAEGAGIFEEPGYAPEPTGFNWGGFGGFLGGLAGTVATVAGAFRGNGAGQNPQAAQKAQAAQQQTASNTNLFLMIGAAVLGLVLVLLLVKRS